MLQRGRALRRGRCGRRLPGCVRLGLGRCKLGLQRSLALSRGGRVRGQGGLMGGGQLRRRLRLRTSRLDRCLERRLTRARRLMRRRRGCLGLGGGVLPLGDKACVCVLCRGHRVGMARTETLRRLAESRVLIERRRPRGTDLRGRRRCRRPLRGLQRLHFCPESGNALRGERLLRKPRLPHLQLECRDGGGQLVARGGGRSLELRMVDGLAHR